MEKIKYEDYLLAIDCIANFKLQIINEIDLALEKNSRKKNIMEFIKKNDNASSASIAKIFNVSRQIVDRYRKKLKNDLLL